MSLKSHTHLTDHVFHVHADRIKSGYKLFDYANSIIGHQSITLITLRQQAIIENTKDLTILQK